MRNTFWLPLIAIAFFSFGASASSTYFSPISIGIVPPIQFPPEDFAITGARISLLYGKQRNIYGIDVGVLGNITIQDFKGMAISGLFNATYGTTTVLGFQLAGAANMNTNNTSIFGLQGALGVNSNTANTTLVGVQAAILANLGKFTTIYGAQLGIFNQALTVNGLQIGLVNTTTNLRGMQIGLLNFYQNGMFEVSPLVNFGF